MERLTIKKEDGSYTFDQAASQLPLIMQKLGEMEDAEEQGLLLRLPCKYNDSLYWVFDGFVREVWFKGVRCDKGYKPQIIARFIDGSTLEAKEKPIAELENIGKTLFFTKEEAEQALAKMKEVRWMIIKNCYSYGNNCPCSNCERECYGCADLLDKDFSFDTEKLCTLAKDYCEAVNGHKVGEKNDSTGSY